MRKLKLLFAGCALMCVSQVAAQTDVTSTYIPNAGFESCTAETTDKATGSNIDYANNGWTISSETGAQSCGAVVTYGGVNVNSVAAPATDNAGNSGNALGISVGWTQSVTYKTANVTLPAGYYILSANVYNNNPDGLTFASKLGFVTTSSSYLSSSPSFPYASWVKDEVAFYLSESTEGYFQIGGTAQNSSSSANAKVFFDNLTLIYSNKQMDYTSSVAVGKNNWAGSGTYGSVTTRDGRTQALTEFYGSSDAGVKLSQKISGLRNGIYEATLFATSHNAWGNYSASLDADADDVAYVYALPEGGTTIQQFFKARHDGGMSKSEPYRVTISNITVEKGALTLGLGLAQSAKTEWQTIQIYSLTRTGNLDLTGLISEYETALSAAKTAATTTETVSATWFASLNTAIETYGEGKVDMEDPDAIEEATNALKEATERVNASISSYATIAAGSIPNESIEGWTNTGTGSLEVNTWSTESGPVGNNTRNSYDGTGMTVPFIQSWIWKGNNNDVYLGNGTVSYTLAGLEPGEVYYAQALVRAYSEGGNVPNGPNFFINNVVTDMTTNGTAFEFSGMKGFYGTLGGAATVGDDGKIVLGVTIQDANYNWVAFKNVSIQSMDDAFKAAVKKVTDLEGTGTIPTAAYQTAYAVVTNYSGENYPTDAAGFETAIAAIEAAAEAATACVEPYANATALLTSAGALASSYPNMKTPIQQATSVLEECSYAVDITNFTTNLTNALAKFNEWIELKAEAEVLATVANDNNDANTTFSGVISAQEANVQEVNSIDDTGLVIVNNAISKVKEAMATYVGAANPVGDGAQFDCTFMLTNPDLSVFSANGKQDGWYTDQTFQTQNSQVMMNNNSVANSTDKTKFAMYEYWSAASCATSDYTVYTKVTLPVGTYRMDALCMTGWGYAASSPDGERNITFSAGDVDGTSITTSTLEPATLDFVQATAGEVKIGLKAHDGNTCNWMGIGYVKLYKVPAQSYEIDENKKWDNTIAGAGDVTLKRTIKKGFNTLVLPFSMTQAEVEDVFGKDSKVYVVSSYEEDKKNISFDINDGINANKPCLLKATEASNGDYTLENRTIVAGEPVANGDKVSMTGTYKTIYVPVGNYIISGDMIYEVDSDEVTLRGTRAYITIDNANGARTLTMSFDDTATGIATLKDGKLEFETGDIYDLSGRKVKNPTKGIYLMNGKKVIK